MAHSIISNEINADTLKDSSGYHQMSLNVNKFTLYHLLKNTL